MTATTTPAPERPENCDDVLKECEDLAAEIDATLLRLVSKPAEEGRPEPAGLLGRLSTLRETLTGVLQRARDTADGAGTAL